jgi:hypothetical protein
MWQYKALQHPDGHVGVYETFSGTCTVEPIRLIGDSVSDLQHTLAAVTAAVSTGVENYDDFQPYGTLSKTGVRVTFDTPVPAWMPQRLVGATFAVATVDTYALVFTVTAACYSCAIGQVLPYLRGCGTFTIDPV